MTGQSRLAVAGVALFWSGTVVAGSLAPGYSARADYVSSLAGRGSEVAAIGIATIAALGLAHLAAAAVSWQAGVAKRASVPQPAGAPEPAAASGRAGAGRVTAVLLALAGIAGLTVAAFRISCPGGAAGCGFDGAPPDLADHVHGLAVFGYELALVAAVLVTAARLFRVRPVAAAAAIIVAVVSVLLVLQLGGADNGWWQRAWLAVNTGWLIWLVCERRSRISRETVGGRG